MIRKSSRGNPYHDEKGRFATADGHKSVSERTPKEYEERTKQRMNSEKQTGPTREEVHEWLSEHEQAYTDASNHFNGLENASKADMEEWIAEHPQLNNDYENHFGGNDIYPSESELNEGLRPEDPDAKGYRSQVIRGVGSEVTVRNLGGQPLNGEITEVGKDYKGDPYYIVSYTDAIGRPQKVAIDDDTLDSFMTSSDIQWDKSEADRIRVENARKYAKDEVLFIQKFGDTQQRCHAAIVKELPKKTSRWSNGYAELARYDHNGKTYTVYKDKDDNGQFSYFAVEDNE